MSSSDPTPQFVETLRTGRMRGFLVPTGVLVSIAMAATGGAWAGAKFFYGNLEQRITATEERQLKFDSVQNDNVRHIAVLEANAVNLNSRVDEINRKLDTIIDLMLRGSRKDAP